VDEGEEALSLAIQAIEEREGNRERTESRRINHATKLLVRY